MTIRDVAMSVRLTMSSEGIKFDFSHDGGNGVADYDLLKKDAECCRVPEMVDDPDWEEVSFPDICAAA